MRGRLRKRALRHILWNPNCERIELQLVRLLAHKSSFLQTVTVRVGIQLDTTEKKKAA